MGKQTKTEQNQVAPVSQPVTNEIINETKQVMYVVVREGYRVSDREYQSPTDESAIAEQEYWNHIAKTYSWGEPVEIVQYESKKHRIW